MALPIAWVDKIFEKLSLVYGRDFAGRWEGMDLAGVKDDWAHELSGLFTHPSAIAHALAHLPDRAPTVLEFRSICRKAPEAPTPRLEYSPAGVERVTTELAKLEIVLPPRGSRVDPKDWARRILADVAAGGKRSMTVVKMARDAVGAA